MSAKRHAQPLGCERGPVGEVRVEAARLLGRGLVGEGEPALTAPEDVQLAGHLELAQAPTGLEVGPLHNCAILQARRTWFRGAFLVLLEDSCAC